MKIKCPKCGKEEIWKSGKTGGKQQYQCKSCKRKFITEKNYSEEFKQKAIAIFGSARVTEKACFFISPLAKLRKLFKIANTSNQRKSKRKSFSSVTVAF